MGSLSEKTKKSGISDAVGNPAFFCYSPARCTTSVPSTTVSTKRSCGCHPKVLRISFGTTMRPTSSSLRSKAKRFSVPFTGVHPK